MKAEAVFADLAKSVNADIVKKAKCIYRFDIKDGKTTKSWVVNLKSGNGSVTEGAGKADCTLIMADTDFVKLMGGKLNPQSAFMSGKLKIKGNMMLAMKLKVLMKAKPSL